MAQLNGSANGFARGFAESGLDESAFGQKSGLEGLKTFDAFRTFYHLHWLTTLFEEIWCCHRRSLNFC